MSGKDERQLAAARQLIGHIAGLLDADLALRLWNGERLSLRAEGGPTDDATPGFAIRSPRAVTRLVRRPRFNTIVELLASGDIEIEGGTLLDIAERRGQTRTRGLFRKLDKKLAVRTLWPFMFGTPAASQSQAYQGGIETSVDKGRDDKALIHFHYDLSNEFYRLFLDPEMVYTCAYFPRWDADIAEAQQAKLDTICRKLRLQPGERFLDIGCGWGALVCHAAKNYGVKAHGVTLAEEQYAYAREKIERLGLQDLVTVELKDYRHLDEPESFDKIASIGMFEAVGIDNHDIYFRQMNRLLRPRGLYLHHCIARPSKANMKKFRKQRAEYKALTTYIFPGGELDTLGMSVNGLERHGFEVHDVEAWREHYARTCRLWTQRLHANREAAIAEVGEAKTRLWLIYLAGCALAFERSAVGIFQTLTSKRTKGASGMPPTRAHLYD